MTTRARWIFLVLTAVSTVLATPQHNPSILEDARVHPTSDGSFGFLYRTQDGIAHAAKGDPGGAIHGRFTYTDPTGLKVNFNYNAGAQAVAQKQQQQQQQQQPQYQRQQQQQPQYQPPAAPARYNPAPPQYEDDYQQPEYDQRPRYSQPAPRRYNEPAPRRYEPAPRRYTEPAPRHYNDPQRYSRPRFAQQNDVFEYDYNRA